MTTPTGASDDLDVIGSPGRSRGSVPEARREATCEVAAAMFRFRKQHVLDAVTFEQSA